MPDMDNSLLSQDDLDSLLKSLTDEAADNIVDTNTDAVNTDSASYLRDTLNKNDEDISDDELDSLVNMLNMNTGYSESTFNDSYSNDVNIDNNDNDNNFSSISKEDDNILDLSADELFRDEPEETFDISKLPLRDFDGLAVNRESTQDDVDEIDLLLNSMPVSNIDLTPDVDLFVQNISTYDGKENDTEKDTVAKEKNLKPVKEKKPLFDVSKFKFFAIISNFFNKILSSSSNAAQNVSNKVIYIVLGVMVALLFVFGYLVVNSLSTLNTIKSDKKENVMHVNNNAQPTSNSTNFVFTSLSVPWNGWDFTLKKMLLDSEASMFYFDRLISLNSVDVTLTDDTGRLYGLDTSYYSDTLTSEKNATDILRFQPLPVGTQRFTINIYDLTSNEVLSFPISLSNPLAYMPVKYLSEPMEIELNDDGMRFTIEDAVFASSGTTLSYKIEKYNNRSTILFAESEYINSKSISIHDSLKTALPVNTFPTQYSFPTEHTVIGQMVFNPIVSLTNNVTINFSNMFKKVMKNTVIDASNLFYDSEEYQTTINSAPFKVILERMGYFNTMYVLVYHAEHASIVQKQMDESISLENTAESSEEDGSQEQFEPKTLQAKLSATLIISLEDGTKIEIEGVNMSNNIGGEVHFYLKDVKGLPNYISRDALSIRIDDISFKMPDVSVKLDLNKFKSSRQPTQATLVQNFIYSAFDDRLQVKSGEKDISSLAKSFDSSIIENSKLSEAYAPLTLEDKAQYTTQIISMSKQDTKRFLAVVGVTWKGTVEGKEVHFYRTHKITVDYLPTGWMITRDEVV